MTLANSSPRKPAEEKVSILIVDDRPDKLLAYETILDDLDEVGLQPKVVDELLGKHGHSASAVNPLTPRR